MTTYQEGDFVKIVTEYPKHKAKVTYEGPLVKSKYGDRLCAVPDLNHSWFVDAIENEAVTLGGAVVVTIERVVGPLPTEPGVYVRTGYDNESGMYAYTLEKNGTVWWFGGDAKTLTQMELIHKEYPLRKVA